MNLEPRVEAWDARGKKTITVADGRRSTRGAEERLPAVWDVQMIASLKCDNSHSMVMKTRFFADDRVGESVTKACGE